MKQAFVLGLKLPIVYNCSGYEKVETLQMLEGIVDIYLTDFKYMEAETAARYSNAPDYPQTYGNQVYISLMTQYTPLPGMEKWPELNRKVTKREYERLLDFAVELGVENGFIQEGGTAEESFIPAFDCEGI